MSDIVDKAQIDIDEYWPVYGLIDPVPGVLPQSEPIHLPDGFRERLRLANLEWNACQQILAGLVGRR